MGTQLTSFTSGMMFGCKRDTYDENMSRHLFGLPESHWDTARKITDQTLVRATPLEGTHENIHRYRILPLGRLALCARNVHRDPFLS